MQASSAPSSQKPGSRQSNSQRESQTSSSNGAGAASVYPTEHLVGGFFRELMVGSLEDSDEAATIRQFGVLLERLIVRRERPELHQLVRQRLDALTADLVFLATFLSTEIDTRSESALDPGDWEVARAAGHAGAQLLLVRQRWLEEVALDCDRTPVPAKLDDFLGCRETSLWPLADPQEAKAVRRIGAYLGTYARRARGQEGRRTESFARRNSRAAVADLVHLSDFVLETSELAPADLAERLVQVSRYLTAAGQKLAEAERTGPDLGDLLE